MKRFFMVFMAIAMLVSLLGCMPKTEETAKVQEITVMVCRPIETKFGFERLVKQFEEETGIKVNMQIYEETDANVEQYRTTATAELISGTGADVYQVDWLSYNELGEKGLLYDFTPILGVDDVLNNEKMLMNIIKSLSLGDAVYGIPLSFQLPGWYSRTESGMQQTQAWGSYTWPEFMELMRTSDTPSRTIDYDREIFRYWLLDEWESWVYEDNPEQPLNTQAIRGALEQVSAWADERLCWDSMAGNVDALSGEDIFYSSYDLGESLLALIYPLSEMYSVPIPSVHAQGEARYPILPHQMYGINSASKNKDAAVAFIKFMAENYDYIKYREWFAYTHRANMREHCEIYFNAHPALASKLDEGNDIYKIMDQMIEKLDTMRFAVVREGINDVLDIITSEADIYFYERKSANEAVTSMEATLKLYLKERM
ncbi:ABC transporter substrate-binding protein [Clostridia bacterium OttesenSCG-928-F22]|nr:ABC transporter substrate-binding protein [Clostridia bacterium OttesenSCG-928-F22]